MALRDQLTLSLFDDTALLGLTTDVPTAAARPIFSPRTLDDPPELLPVDYRLAGERRLTATWRECAADNLAAIELLGRIEAEDRPATADEQQILARFVGFGASELASRLFPRAGEATTPLGLIARLEHALNGIEAELLQQQKYRSENETRLRDYEARLDRPFELAAELELKQQALADLLAELAADQQDAA